MAGGLEGVGHAVVLAGLPDDWVAVVLPRVVVGRDPVAGVESVEGLLGLALWVGAVDIGVAVAELVGEVGVVVAVAGVQVGAETAGDLVGWPVLELMSAQAGRGLEVLPTA